MEAGSCLDFLILYHPLSILSNIVSVVWSSVVLDADWRGITIPYLFRLSYCGECLSFAMTSFEVHRSSNPIESRSSSSVMFNSFG